MLSATVPLMHGLLGVAEHGHQYHSGDEQELPEYPGPSHSDLSGRGR